MRLCKEAEKWATSSASSQVLSTDAENEQSQVLLTEMKSCCKWQKSNLHNKFEIILLIATTRTRLSMSWQIYFSNTRNGTYKSRVFSDCQKL